MSASSPETTRLSLSVRDARFAVEHLRFLVDREVPTAADHAAASLTARWLADQIETALTVAETTGVEDDGPECDLCGKTDCPDADLPEFSEPRECVLNPVYSELRYDRCDYGCGRDITKATVRRAAQALVEIISPSEEATQ